MSDPEHVWDPGLQPERTVLAWRRIAIALLGMALVAPRFVWPVFGSWAIVPSGFVVVGAIAVLVVSHRRYVRVHRGLTADNTALMPDGRLQFVTLLLALLLAAVGLVIILR